jgi:DNA-binding NarL/FixJ family response regulator
MTHKVLLVEDNGLFRKTVARIIRNRFPELAVEEAACAREAREKVGSTRPDVVFMDIHLPDGDGIRLTEGIKSKIPHVIVVMLSNLDSDEYREAAVEAGADGFISKRKATLDAISDVLAHIVKEGAPGIESRLHRH